MSGNDEKLSTTVPIYEIFEILYNKSHADFQRKDIKKNAWKSASEELGLEYGFLNQRVFKSLSLKH